MENKVKIGIGVAVVALVVAGVSLGFFNTGLKGQISRDVTKVNQNKVGLPAAEKFNADKFGLVASKGNCKNPELLYAGVDFPGNYVVGGEKAKYKDFQLFYEALTKELADPNHDSNCMYEMLGYYEQDNIMRSACPDKNLYLNGAPKTKNSNEVNYVECSNVNPTGANDLNLYVYGKIHDGEMKFGTSYYSKLNGIGSEQAQLFERMKSFTFRRQ